MTANTPAPAALTEITVGTNGTFLQLAKGDQVRVTTTGGEVIEGTFVSVTARGIRIHATPVLEASRYVTRKMSVVADVELLAAEAPEVTPKPQTEPTPAPLSDAAVDEEFAALVANSTEFGHGNTAIEQLVEGEAAAAAQAPTAPAAESNEDAPAAEYDTNPMVGGKHLSDMTFAEVMVLAKQYKTPGRGVARIGALRDGVALAISQEAGRLASAS